MVADNVRYAPKNLSILKHWFPNLESLTLDFMPEESPHLKCMRNAAVLGEFVLLTMGMNNLKEYKLNLTSLDLRGLQGYLVDTKFGTHPTLEKMIISELTSNYLWIEEVDKKV